jgi:aldose 1-epimerase
MRKLLFMTLLLSLAFLVSGNASFAAKAGVTREVFGRMPDGKVAYLYTLTNGHGMTVKITNYGGIIKNLIVPDRKGKEGDVVLGFDTLKEYVKGNVPYFGALIGRYGNRIAKGHFKLDGKTYTLPINNGPNSLHGGIKGFDKRLWDSKIIKTSSGEALQLTYLSKNGEEGYPGNLKATVVYSLLPNNTLKIDYKATTDKDTVLNLTNHSYFNLNGEGKGTILKHMMMLNANEITPTDSTLIPTGKFMAVKGTPYDFRKPVAIGARINAKNTQLKYGQGYDINYVLNHHGDSLQLAAQVYSPKSGREMTIYTTQPGIQFYSGNVLYVKKGKGGVTYPKRYGFALETQHYPDSPNHPNFPTTTLKPGQVYHQVTELRFSVR